MPPSTLRPAFASQGSQTILPPNDTFRSNVRTANLNTFSAEPFCKRRTYHRLGATEGCRFILSDSGLTVTRYVTADYEKLQFTVGPALFPNDAAYTKVVSGRGK
jgi:hypothetical protein